MTHRSLPLVISAPLSLLRLLSAMGNSWKVFKKGSLLVDAAGVDVIVTVAPAVDNIIVIVVAVSAVGGE